MKNENITTVKELFDILKTMPQDAPVLVSGYEGGYENFYHPMIKKVVHFPENPCYEGEYQLAESNNGIEAVILQRFLRND